MKKKNAHRKKRTRKNPNAPDRERCSGFEYTGKFRYAGDVKRKYKLSVGDAVLAFLLVHRTYQKKGGKCSVTYRTIEAINKGYTTNVSRHLKHLKDKGVVSEYKYDNKGDGYCHATVCRQFADDTRHSNHYTLIDLFDFNYEVMATWSLSDRVLFLIAKSMWVKGKTYSASSLARFAGMTHPSVIKKLEDWSVDDIVRLQFGEAPIGVNNPYKVSDVAYEGVQKSVEYDEFQNEIKKCLPYYENSDSRLVVDAHGIGVIFKRVTPGTSRVISTAENIVLMGIDSERKIMKRAYMWLKRNGPGSPRYESLREKFKECEAATSNPDLLVTSIIPAKEFKPRKNEVYRGACKRVYNNMFSWDGRFRECPELTEDHTWTSKEEIEIAKEEANNTDVDENGYKMYGVDDWF